VCTKEVLHGLVNVNEGVCEILDDFCVDIWVVVNGSRNKCQRVIITVGLGILCPHNFPKDVLEPGHEPIRNAETQKFRMHKHGDRLGGGIYAYAAQCLDFRDRASKEPAIVDLGAFTASYKFGAADRHVEVAGGSGKNCILGEVANLCDLGLG
jgi:hypothetical protein